MTDDLAARLKASNEAIDRVRDLQAAADDLIKYANRLFNDVHDQQAFFECLLAISIATAAAVAFYKITGPYDE